MNFETWNIQSIKDKSDFIIKDLRNIRMNIMILIKTRKTGTDSENCEDYIRLYRDMPKEQKVKLSVLILVKRT